MSDYSNIRRNEFLMPTTAWTNPENMLAQLEGHLLYHSIYKIFRIAKSRETKSRLTISGAGVGARFIPGGGVFF